jgi:Lrp/AsnC family transcriptional regulator
MARTNRSHAAPSMLDAYDLKILSELQDDASQPITEIATAANLSQNACWRRLKRLESEGVIVKRVALLDPKKLEAGVTVIVTVWAAEHTEAWLKSFVSAIARFPEVVEFYRMSGEIDYLLKLRVSGIEEYDQVYKRLLKAAPLGDVTSSFVMEEIKNTTSIPLPHPR